MAAKYWKKLPPRCFAEAKICSPKQVAIVCYSSNIIKIWGPNNRRVISSPVDPPSNFDGDYHPRGTGKQRATWRQLHRPSNENLMDGKNMREQRVSQTLPFQTTRMGSGRTSPITFLNSNISWKCNCQYVASHLNNDLKWRHHTPSFHADSSRPDGFRKRRSDSSIPSFFKNEDRHSRIWQFMEAPRAKLVVLGVHLVWPHSSAGLICSMILHFHFAIPYLLILLPRHASEFANWRQPSENGARMCYSHSITSQLCLPGLAWGSGFQPGGVLLRLRPELFLDPHQPRDHLPGLAGSIGAQYLGGEPPPVCDGGAWIWMIWIHMAPGFGMGRRVEDIWMSASESGGIWWNMVESLETFHSRWSNSWVGLLGISAGVNLKGRTCRKLSPLEAKLR